MPPSQGTPIEQIAAAVTAPTGQVGSVPAVAANAPGSTRIPKQPASPAPAPVASNGPDAATLTLAVKDINAQLLTDGETLQLSVDSQSGRTIVVVRDAQTGNVVRQVPTEQVLRLASALRNEGNSSVLLDLKA